MNLHCRNPSVLKELKLELPLNSSSALPFSMNMAFNPFVQISIQVNNLWH